MKKLNIRCLTRLRIPRPTDVRDLVRLGREANGNEPPARRSAAYLDIANELGKFAFFRVQGSVYISDNDDLANLFQAIIALKGLPWFASSVRDIRAFKVEHWSDFTGVIKSQS